MVQLGLAAHAWATKCSPMGLLRAQGRLHDPPAWQQHAVCAHAACRLHMLTKHRVFRGPGFQVAVELAEAANGGQVCKPALASFSACPLRALQCPQSCCTGRGSHQEAQDVLCYAQMFVLSAGQLQSDLPGATMLLNRGWQQACRMWSSGMCAQVLMTHDAWDRLQHSMPAAGFPVVEQLGLAKIAAWPVPIWVYQVLQPVAPSMRCGLLAGCLWATLVASIEAAVAGRDDGRATQLTNPLLQLDSPATPSAAGRCRGRSAEWWVCRACAPCDTMLRLRR